MAESSRRWDSFGSRVQRRHRVVAAVSCMVVAVGGLIAATVRAQTPGRTMTVSPNEELTHGQYVDVAWSGYTGNVRIRLCPAAATSVADCAQSSPSQREPGDSKVGISSGGAGSKPFIIKAGDVVPASGADPFFCDAENACEIVVFEIDASGAEKGFDDDTSVAVPLDFAISTIACPFGGDLVAGSGGSSLRGAVVQWQSEVCRDPHELNVSYVISNSVQGVDAFVRGLPDSDFAGSGMPLRQTEKDDLTERGVTPVHVPVAAGSLVLVYNVWFDRNGDGVKEQMKDLQLSPATLAKILQGRAQGWDDPAIVADNPHVTMPSKQVKVVGRADNSAATFWLTSWLWATAQDEWKAGGDVFDDGPTTIFPAGNAVILRTGTDAVADYVRRWPGEVADDNPDIPFAGYIGFVYSSEAIKLGLPVAALWNGTQTDGKKNYVKPTTEGVTAAFNAGTIGSDGVFAPNFAATDSTAYPLPVASYVISATSDSDGVDEERAETLGRFLMYTNTTGQQAAASRGYAPLTPAMVAAAEANITRMTAKPAAELAPSPAPSASPSVAAQTTVTSSSPPTTATSETPTQSSPPSQAGADGAQAQSAPARGPTDEITPVASRTTQTDPAPVEAAKKAVEAVRRAVEGVIGLGAVGSVPVGVPALLLFAICALLVGRLLVNASRRRAIAGASDHDGPPPSGVAALFSRARGRG